MTPDELGHLLQPIQEAGVDVAATGAASLIATVLGAYRHLGEDHQERIIMFIVSQAWDYYNAALAEEARIRAALVPDTSGRVH